MVTPKWLASAGEIGPLRAFVVGASMALANPKILALVLAATASLAYLTLSSRQVVAVAILFVILGSSPIITLVIAHAIGGQETRARIELLKGFLLRNNNLILMVVFAMLGMSVLEMAFLASVERAAKLWWCCCRWRHGTWELILRFPKGQ